MFLQAFQAVRMGITYQGRQVIGLCPDDIDTVNSADHKSLKAAVTKGKLGKCNVSKDFVPLNSTNPKVQRPHNSHARKCTVIWLDLIPLWLQTRLSEGIFVC